MRRGGFPSKTTGGGGGGPSPGTPALVLDTVNTQGSSGLYIPSDSHILVFDSTNPTTAALGDAPSPGSGVIAAYRNHKHGMFANSAVAYSGLGDVHTGFISGFLFTVSNTTPQSITNLTVPIGASATEIWYVEVFMQIIAANTTMNGKFVWTAPAGMTAQWGGHGRGPTESNAWGSTTAGTAAFASNTLGAVLQRNILATPTLIQVAGFFVNAGGNAGTLQFQGSQNTSDPGQLTLTYGWINARKVQA